MIHNASPLTRTNVRFSMKAHDAAISKLAWAHPEFGTIIASCSFDRTVKIWEQLSPGGQQDVNVSSGTATGIVPTQGQQAGSTPRWVERAVLHDARGTVRAVEFAPHRLGLKLVSWSMILSKNLLSLYTNTSLGSDIFRQHLANLRMPRTALPHNMAALRRSRHFLTPRLHLTRSPIPPTLRGTSDAHPCISTQPSGSRRRQYGSACTTAKFKPGRPGVESTRVGESGGGWGVVHLVV